MRDAEHSPAAGRSGPPHPVGTVKTRFAPDGTSELGFGCALLMGSVPRERSLRLLATAHDHGIRHFDTARLYGHGWSEAVLGQFLQGRRDRITVATKFGLEPPRIPGPLVRLRSVARAAVDAISPGLRAAAGRGARRLVRRGAFTVADARRALETSLRQLRTDRIDLWLLHDCTLEDLSTDELPAFLDAERARGTIVGHGIATSAEEAARIAMVRPDLCGIVQIADDPAAPVSTGLRAAIGRPADIVQHSVLRPTLEALPPIARDPLKRAAFWMSTGLDPWNTAAVAAATLAAARSLNPRGVTLVSSSRPDHLSALLAAHAAGPSPATVGAIGRALAEAGAAPGRTPVGGRA